jgi:hypothetical protein
MDVHPTKNVSIGIDPYPNDIFPAPFSSGISQLANVDTGEAKPGLTGSSDTAPSDLRGVDENTWQELRWIGFFLGKSVHRKPSVFFPMDGAFRFQFSQENQSSLDMWFLSKKYISVLSLRMHPQVHCFVLVACSCGVHQGTHPVDAHRCWLRRIMLNHGL